MALLDAIKSRRSIRKYQDKQIPREDLEKIIEAGTYASNAGGGQRSMIVGIRNAELVEKLGRISCEEDRRLLHHKRDGQHPHPGPANMVPLLGAAGRRRDLLSAPV